MYVHINEYIILYVPSGDRAAGVIYKHPVRDAVIYCSNRVPYTSNTIVHDASKVGVDWSGRQPPRMICLFNFFFLTHFSSQTYSKVFEFDKTIVVRTRREHLSYNAFC